MMLLFARVPVACMGSLALLLIAPTIAAEPVESGDLSLAQAISAALAGNPDLLSSAYTLRAADARIAQADLGPNPELSVQLEDFAGTGRVRGVDAAQATFALSQVIELGGKRGRRRDAAQAERNLLEIEGEARQLDVLAEVTRRYIHLATDQEQLKLARRATELAQKTLAGVGQRVTAAKSPEVELHRARIALTRVKVEQEHAEHKLLSSRRKLAAMWGENDPRFDAVSADLFSLRRPGEFEALVTRLKANPDFIRFASQARLRDAELRLAETRRMPNVQVGAGIRRLQETQDEAFVMSFSMPLFSGARSAGAIAEASARREQVAADEQAAWVRAQAQLFELYQELRHSLTAAETLRTEVLPQMESVLAQTEYAYRRGRYSYLEWIDAQRELIDAQRSLIEAAANAHRYVAEIERLTGEPLAGAPSAVPAN